MRKQAACFNGAEVGRSGELRRAILALTYLQLNNSILCAVAIVWAYDKGNPRQVLINCTCVDFESTNDPLTIVILPTCTLEW